MSAEAATDFFANLGTKVEVKKPVMEQPQVHHTSEDAQSN
jgi:hypothetical protein